MRKTMTSYYCHLNSGGHVSTNLQLFSLRAAISYWKDFQGISSPSLSQEKQYGMLITVLLGSSLAQLLGQNFNLHKNSQQVDKPDTLLSNLFKTIRISPQDQQRIQREFSDFIVDYDACRHFGPPKHARLDDFTRNKIKKFVALTKEIWNIVIDYFRAKNANIQIEDIDEVLDPCGVSVEYPDAKK